MRNMLAAVVLAVFALGFSGDGTAATVEPTREPIVAAVTVQPVPPSGRLPDEAMMMIVGGALIALAAAVRRSA
jgi:hypothetical protein